jgi:hypothetical protein
MVDYYKLLGIDRLDGLPTIKKAIKKLRNELEAQKDLGVADDLVDSRLEELERIMEVLLDPDAKQLYDAELATTPKEKIDKGVGEQYFDYSQFRDSDLIPWKELIEYDGLPSIQAYFQILDKVVILPFPELQKKVLLSCLLCPTPLARTLPIVFVWGVSGSGKSQIGKFASQVWGTIPVGGGTTYAALRRKISKIRQVQIAGKLIELPHLLVWDDIELRILKRSPDLLAMLKSGYSRSTSKIEIAKKDDDFETNVFDCFGMRVFSSVYPFFSDPFFIELNRRMILIECQKTDRAIEVVDFESIDWSSMKTYTNKLWGEDSGRPQQFTDNRKKVTNWIDRHKPDSPDRVNLIKDTLTCGLTLGIWNKPQEAFDDYFSFFEMMDSIIERKQDNVYRVIKELVEKSVNDCKAKGFQPYVKPLELRQLCEAYARNGVFDNLPKPNRISEVMTDLGWEMDLNDRVWYQAK